MDSKRATDILNSPSTVEVTHHGKFIWIEQVEGNFAQVHYLDTREKLRVPVGELIEA